MLTFAPTACTITDPYHLPSPSDRSSKLSADDYWIATGVGDLSKGLIDCQKVADTSARAELAKQVRVAITSQLIDRSREQTGRPAVVDVELLHREEAGELLQDAEIVTRTVDTEKNLCFSKAVMQRPQRGSEALPK